MTLTLFIFLIIYLVFAGIILLFYLANFYHLVRFGALNFATVFISFVFLCGIIILAYFSYQYLLPVSWNEPISLFGSLRLEVPHLELPKLPNF